MAGIQGFGFLSLMKHIRPVSGINRDKIVAVEKLYIGEIEGTYSMVISSYIVDGFFLVYMEKYWHQSDH